MERGHARRYSGELGQSLVEIGLALPLVVLALLGGADLGHALGVQLAIQSGARVAAEAMTLTSTPTQAGAQSYALAEAGSTRGVDSSKVTVTLTQHKGDFSDGSCAPTSPSLTAPCYVTVRVVYTYRTLLPWPGIPTYLTFDRGATFLRYR